MTDGARIDPNLASLARSLGDWAEVLRGGELGSVERVAELLDAAADSANTYAETVGNLGAAYAAEVDAYDRLTRRYDDRGDVLTTREAELAEVWAALERTAVERDSAEFGAEDLRGRIAELERERATLAREADSLAAMLDAAEDALDAAEVDPSSRDLARMLEAERQTAEWEDA